MGPAALSAAHDLLVLDLDGVLYVGRAAVPGAVEALATAGLPTGFATNNASRTPQEVAAHLTELGIPARPEQVTTSSQAGALLVRARRVSLIPLAATVALVTIVAALTFGVTRYRAAAEPALLVLAAVGLERAARSLHSARTRQRRLSPAAAPPPG